MRSPVSQLQEHGYVVVPDVFTAPAEAESSVRELLLGLFGCEKLIFDHVAPQPGASMLSYTHGGMSLHTDSVYSADPCRVMALGCVTSGRGGESLLRDTRDLGLSADLDAWLRRPAWTWIGRDGTVTRPRPVIEEGFGLRWWRRTLTGLTKLAQDRADEFEALVSAEADVVELPLAPGAVLVVDNRRVLHGRRPFEGDRMMLRAWGW